MMLANAHAAQPGFVHTRQVDVAPDAGIGQPRAPVPAKHAVRLAQMREAAHGIGGAVDKAVFKRFGHKLGGRKEGNVQVVLPCMHMLLYIHLPGAVHVVGA